VNSATENELILSFVVPVYNVESFIGDCLKSLLAQDVSKEQYEIVCIDDGSTDNSGKILDDYAKDNSNIKVIHSENKGVSAARNIGISASAGKYIWFVDSDDMIAANCLKLLFKVISKHSPEYIRFNNKKINENARFENICSDIIDAVHLKRYDGRISGNHVWKCITKSDIIKDNNLKFEEQMKFGEDTIFAYMIYTNMSGTGWVDLQECFYYYRTRNTSAVNTKTKERYTQQTKDLFRMAYIYKEILKNHTFSDADIVKNTQCRQHLATIGALTIFPKSSLNYKETMKRIKEEKIYPFSFTVWNIKTARTFKAKVIEFVKLFFKFRPFYRAYYLLMKK